MLEAKSLHKAYDNGKAKIQVLKGIDLQIEKGKFVAIIGPSGAGKSTLLHILGGLDSPTEGKVFLDGEDIYKMSDVSLSSVRNKKIGFVFQFYHLLSEFSVLENVMMPALISHSFQNQAREILGQVGLADRVDHFPSQLSGGEQQRVALARALVNNPELLLCDEPTGNLDSKTGSGIVALIRKINIENKTTVVMVTHNLELAESADVIYHLSDGMLS